MFWESQSSTFWFQLLWGLLDGVQHAVNFFQQVGLLVSAKELKNMAIYIYIYIVKKGHIAIILLTPKISDEVITEVLKVELCTKTLAC